MSCSPSAQHFPLCKCLWPWPRLNLRFEGLAPLLTHSLMVTAKLSLSLCLLCLKCSKFDLLILKTEIPFAKHIEKCQFLKSCGVLSSYNILKVTYQLLCFTFSLMCDSSSPSLLLLRLIICFFIVWLIRSESEKWTQWGSLHTLSSCLPSSHPSTLYCLLMEAVVIVMQ